MAGGKLKKNISCPIPQTEVQVSLLLSGFTGTLCSEFSTYLNYLPLL
jgi:hypothetical protein